jgi:hypothetical protein
MESIEQRWSHQLLSYQFSIPITPECSNPFEITSGKNKFNVFYIICNNPTYCSWYMIFPNLIMVLKRGESFGKRRK